MSGLSIGKPIIPMLCLCSMNFQDFKGLGNPCLLVLSKEVVVVVEEVVVVRLVVVKAVVVVISNISSAKSPGIKISPGLFLTGESRNTSKRNSRNYNQDRFQNRHGLEESEAEKWGQDILVEKTGILVDGKDHKGIMRIPGYILFLLYC